MSIPIFIAMMPFFLSYLWSYQIYDSAIRRQKTTIALDNTAMAIGRQDRDTFNLIRNTNRWIASLEKAHHPVHLAVRSGVVEPSTVALDLKLEALIHSLHRGVYGVASAMWAKTPLMAQSELVGLETKVISMRRSPLLPVKEQSCPVCFLARDWEVEVDRASTYLRVENTAWVQSRFKPALWIHPLGESLKQKEAWNYQLSLH